MKTSVNSDTCTKVGSRMPTTPSHGALRYMTKVRAAAPTNNNITCTPFFAVTISAQTTNVLQMIKPNHDALSMNATKIATAASASATARCGTKYLRSWSQEISVA